MGRGIGVGAVVLVSLAATACGSGAPIILNTEKVERAIEAQTLAQRHKRVNVSCPSGVVQRTGLVFACTAVFRGGQAQFTVTELDAVGHVRFVAK
jgi:hypothetical protein